MSKKIILDIAWFFVVMVAVGLCLWGINIPYVGIYNANNNYLALASKNFIRFGFSTLHFLPTYYVGQTLPPVVPYYLHHPVLFFLFAAVPFVIFGSAHWVVHVSALLFIFASAWLLFRLVHEVANAEIARWTAAFALLLSLTSFFWKYMFFEQSSMFFTLLVLYFAVLYWKRPHTKYLWGIGFAALLGGATDWYGGYLFFGLLYALLARVKGAGYTLLSYTLGLLVGLGTYGIALVSTGNLSAVMEGFSARSLTAELTGLSYWPIRLLVVTLIRIIVYGSPFIFFGIRPWIEQKNLRNLGVIFFIIGSINLIVLPSATWGHSYFLYYLVPFLALLCGIWVTKLAKRGVGVVCAVLLIQVMWSAGVHALKISQVTKQTWKYQFGRDVSFIIPRYSTVEVLEYPGDVLQNYFFINAIPSSPASRYVVAGDLNRIEVMKSTYGVREFHYGSNTGYLVDKEAKGMMRETKEFDVPENRESQPSFWLRLYRWVRDLLGSTQI